MSAPVENNAVLRSQKSFERLLALYPKAHRNEYGPAMSQLFRDQCRDAWQNRRVWGLVSLWLHVLPDLVETSLLEHLSTLKGRKTMLEKISEITNPGTAPLKTFFTVFAVVFLLVFGTTAIVTFLLPQTYASTVRLRVEQNPGGSPVQGGPASAAGAYDPYLIQTEFEILQSEMVLGKVIELLNLNARWGARYEGEGIEFGFRETLRMLRERLEVRQIRNTSLIEVRVFGDIPDEAALIANTIAEVFEKHRMEKSRQLAQSAVALLEMRFKEQEEEVRKAQAEVDQLRKELGISGLDATADAAPSTLEGRGVRQLHSQLVSAETFLAREETTLKELETLSAERRRDAIQTVVGQDAELSALFSEHNLSQQRLIALQKEYTPENPVYLNAKLITDEAARRIKERVEGVMIGLEARVRVQRAAVDNLKGKINEAVETAERGRPYYDAKLRLDELMRFRAVLQMKLDSEQLDAELPKAALVEILDRATPSLQSVRPNKPFNLFVGAVAGFLLGTLIGAVVARGSFWSRRKDASHVATV